MKTAREEAEDMLVLIYDDFEWARRRNLALKPGLQGWEVVKNLYSVFDELVVGAGENPVEAIAAAQKAMGAR